MVKIELPPFWPEITPFIEKIVRRPQNPTIKVCVLAPPPTTADIATR